MLPVYNDWEALADTLTNIGRTFEGVPGDLPYPIIVNDGSTQAAPAVLPTTTGATILHLHRNLGHQKAIAVALSYVNEHFSFDRIVVMDADGEDMPARIPSLIARAEAGGPIVLAGRTHRHEGPVFQLLYRMYRLFFFLLTGKKIAFGNFCVLGPEHVQQLVHYPEIWNSLSGGILKSGIPLISVPTARGRRHHGSSKMNLTSLIIHGLNTISVFIEAISVRILVLSFAIILFSVLAILTITFIRVFTPYAISGWASILASSMLVILLQSFLISLVMIVIFLSSQSQRKLIPAHHYTDYLQRTETLAHA